MAVWNATTPDDDDVDALDIYTHIQETKVMLSERMKANNGTFDAHNVCQASEDGLHDASKVGFAKVSTWASRITTGKEGTLHFITSPAENRGLYIFDIDLNFVATGVNNHGLLDDLDDDDNHEIYLLLGGTRQMTGDLTLEDVVTITDAFGAGNGDALDPAHHDSESWYTAHSANGIAARHVADASIAQGEINVETGTNPTSFAPPDLNLPYFFPTGYGASATPYIQAQAASMPTLTFASGITVEYQRIKLLSEIV